MNTGSGMKPNSFRPIPKRCSASPAKHRPEDGATLSFVKVAVYQAPLLPIGSLGATEKGTRGRPNIIKFLSAPHHLVGPVSMSLARVKVTARFLP